MPAPWAVDDAPADYVEKTVRAIVGIELEVDRAVGKRKLSQNRDDADRDGVLEHLPAELTGRTVAEAMAEAAADDG